MKLLIATLMFTLLCWPTTALPEREGANNLSYEFSQSDNHYAFYGTFFIMADPNDLIHILFDFEHLTNFVTSPDSIVLVRKEKNCYEVCYTYRKLLLENKFTYRKTLIRERQKIIFELIASEQTGPILPKVLSSRGYYEIKPDGKGYRVIYFEKVRMDSSLPNGLSSRMAKKEAAKFLQELKKYVERTCY